MPVDELPAAVEYRVVADLPAYRVGTDGSLWTRYRRKGSGQGHGARYIIGDEWLLLAGGLDKDGYRKAVLCYGDGRRRYVRLNVLILYTFVGPPPEGMKNPTAAHWNGVKTDNRLTNLRWATQKDNIADKVAHGTHQAGEKHGMAVLTGAEVLEMRRLRAAGDTFASIAAKFDRKYVTVYAAIKGKNWRHLEEARTR
jgi:hypothetical protein